MKIIFDYNRTIYEPETDSLYPGVLDLLGKLAKQHELSLITQDEGTRRSTIELMGLDKFFTEILFVSNKSTDIFQKVLRGSSKAIVVGDRLQGEIKIGNQLGLVTVRVKQGIFSGYSPKNKIEVPDHEINQILELEKIIEIYEK